MKILHGMIILILALAGCGGGGGGGGGGDDGGCAGNCAFQSLTVDEVSGIISRAVSHSASHGVNATIAIVDRVGNVLALYQMPGAATFTRFDGLTGARGGLEGVNIPATLAVISKAGTGAYLSSQGNAFSTRTASQIVQENFNPGELRQPGGPLFGVQFSQLLCGDLLGRNIGSGRRGPKPLPLGLSADPGGIPLYKGGDIVGGIGVEIDGIYRLDRVITDYDSDVEELVATGAASGFDAPVARRADNIVAGGKSLRYVDSEEADSGDPVAPLNVTHLVAVPPLYDGALHAGVQYGTAESGVFVNGTIASLTTVSLRSGVAQGGMELRSGEVQAILDAAMATAGRARAAIRTPLDSPAAVSVFVVDVNGTPIGFAGTPDAPIFGIDVSLQKARTAAFFSGKSGLYLSSAGLGRYVTATTALVGDKLSGNTAWTARSVGNIARPFFPDGINENGSGPLSRSAGEWSPFNTGLQLDLVLARLGASLGASSPFLSCNTGEVGRRVPNGIQIFPGAVPLYREGTLVGAVGVSGDGVDQDDLVAFYAASRAGLDFVGRTTIGDSILGFHAPHAIRIDRNVTTFADVRLRYVNCPEAPFIGSSDQNVCEG